MSNCHLNFLVALFVTQERRGQDGSDAVNRRVNAPGLIPPFSRRCYPFVTGTRRKARRFNLAGTFYGYQSKNSAPDSHASSVSGRRNRNLRAVSSNVPGHFQLRRCLTPVGLNVPVVYN